MNQRLSKIGPALSRFTQAGGPGLALKKDAPTRFTVMNELVEVDAQINGEEYVDVFKQFNFPAAMTELSDTREKLYLKVLQSIGDSLNPDDP